MDLAAVFHGRTFNKEDLIQNPPPFKPTIVRTKEEDDNYRSLTNYYKNLEQEEELTHPFMDFNRSVHNDNFANYNKKIIDYDSMFTNCTELSIEDEILLIRSYHKGEKYVDSFDNVYEVISRDDNYIEVMVNGHLPKFRKSSIKLTRDAFLNKMSYKYGNETDLYKIQ